MTSRAPALAVGLLLSGTPATLALGGLVPGRIGALTPLLAFAVTQWALPGARPTRAPAVTPVNIVWAAFALQLAIAPALFLAFGPVEWVFPVEQSWGAISGSALLTAMSFPCWALGRVLFRRLVRSGTGPSAWPPVPAGLIGGFIVAGMVGLALLALPTVPVGAGSVASEAAPASADPLNVLRLLLRPFLAAAGIALLSNAVVAHARGEATIASIRGRLLLCGVLVLLSFGTLDWRRAPLLAVLLGLVAACALILQRPRMRGALGLLGVGAVAFFLVRVLRSPGASFASLFSTSGEADSVLDGINTEAQTYGGGLQMVAFLLDHVELLGSLDGWGQIHAALSPLPLLGAPFRDETPTALYNALFLNRSDQALPLVGQLFLDFGAVTVAAGFVAVGALTQALQHAFERSGTIVQAAIWATPSAWLAFSLGAGTTGLYQSLIYFSAPAYVLLVAMSSRSRRSQNDLAVRPFAAD